MLNKKIIVVAVLLLVGAVAVLDVNATLYQGSFIIRTFDRNKFSSVIDCTLIGDAKRHRRWRWRYVSNVASRSTSQPTSAVASTVVSNVSTKTSTGVVVSQVASRVVSRVISGVVSTVVSRVPTNTATGVVVSYVPSRVVSYPTSGSTSGQTSQVTLPREYVKKCLRKKR